MDTLKRKCDEKGDQLDVLRKGGRTPRKERKL